MSFPVSLRLTQRGQEAITDSLGGVQLEFDHWGIGDGTQLDFNARTMTELNHQVAVVPVTQTKKVLINPVGEEDDPHSGMTFLRVRGLIRTGDLPNDTVFSELGLFAKDPYNPGFFFLFGYTNAMDNAEVFRVRGSVLMEEIVQTLILVLDDCEVALFVDPSAGATIFDIMEAIEDHDKDPAAHEIVVEALKGWVEENYIPLTQKGAINGVATLESNKRIPIAQLPTSATANRVLAVGAVNTTPSYQQVSNAMLADGSVGTTKLADNAVATAKLPNGAVTNAKMASMAANTIKGRASNSGAPQDLTPQQVLDMLGIDLDSLGGGGSSGGGTVTVINNLTSASTTSALSANQGRILNERFEQGTWTPQLANGPGAIQMTDNGIGSRYVRVGRMVTVYLACTITNTNLVINSNTNQIQISNLPFASTGGHHYLGSLGTFAGGEASMYSLDNAQAMISGATLSLQRVAGNPITYQAAPTSGTWSFTATVTYETNA